LVASPRLGLRQNFGRHILLLELDLDVYVELLQPFLDVLEKQTGLVEEENSDSNATMQNKSKLGLDCESI